MRSTGIHKCMHALRSQAEQTASFVMRRRIFIFPVIAFVLFSLSAIAQGRDTRDGTVLAGVARVDITPQGPIRLAGYAARSKQESDGIIHRLSAKALALGSDEDEISIFMTVDLVGIPGHITKQLIARLSKKIDIDAAHLVIAASHTHGGPEVGNLMNILQYRGRHFSDSLLALDQQVHIAEYTQQLLRKLEQVVMEAMADRKPSRIAWGMGQAGFAKNRRAQGGPVDHSLPLLRVTTPAGELRAVLVNYACHGTTLGGAVNKVHGDWIAEAQLAIEGSHPGAIAMVALGCAGDSNPDPRGTIGNMKAHGAEIARSVENLLASPLQPLTRAPVARMRWVELPFSHIPSVAELVEASRDESVKGFYARRALDRLARGHAISETLAYPVQTWAFGDALVMINLAGEVVVDYAVRLKDEYGAEKLWINAYANDVPCYIASRRVIREGGYEAESSMYWYDKPSPFSEDVEDIIIEAVRAIMPASYRKKRR